MKSKRVVIYLAIALSILGWWAVAFHDHSSVTPTATTEPLSSPLIDTLSPLRRESLHEALGGDVALMRELMAAWEHDAQLLIARGVPGIQHMPQPKIVAHPMHITDDDGHSINLASPLQRFLPQTYLASTVLLALVPPEQIVAIPIGLRDLPHIYPSALLDKIPLNIDRYNSEILYQAHPDLAFVAHYSHPTTLDALRSQGIPLFMINKIDTLPDILSAISRIGYLTHKPEETELLLAFVEAVMRSIDNRLHAMTWEIAAEAPPQKVLFLHYSDRFSLPTTKNMTGQLIQRINQQTTLFLIPVIESTSNWKVPITQEAIALEHPNALILSTMDGNHTSLPPGLHHHRVAFVDEMIQQSLTQHVALAYFDIYNSLLRM